MNKAAIQERLRSLLSPVVTLLETLGVTPIQVTLFGLALHVLSAVIIGSGQPLAGGLVLLFAAACDGLDGSLARRTGRVTRFGAFLDSSVDRIDETVVLTGVATYFLVRGGSANLVWAVVAVLALGGSLITSYTRARAEGLGLQCKVGAFERPERVIVTVLGLLLGHTPLIFACIVLTVVSWYTVYQRVRHVHRLTGDEPFPAAARPATLEQHDAPPGGPAEVDAGLSNRAPDRDPRAGSAAN